MSQRNSYTTREPNAPTRGLTLGKFAPLHRGHQFVIETALAEGERRTVVGESQYLANKASIARERAL